jgi:hypothetical protein
MDVPAAALAHRGKQLRRWLAVWFAALLAFAPVAHPSLPLEPAASRAASVRSLDLRDQSTTRTEEPGSRLRPAQPSAPGVFSRLSLVETTFGLPPLKPPSAWLGVEDARPVAPRAIAAPVGEIRAAFHRGSVGTARTPTGPPV